MRSRLTWASSRWASAAASWARSWLVSSRTSTAPAPTRSPEAKSIFSTMPGRSALTVTPCTASAVPIALTLEGQRSRRATIVVTASGGGCHDAPCAMAVRICWNFTKPRPTTSNSIDASTRIIRLAMSESPCYWLLPPRWMARSSISDPVARAISVTAVR